MAGYRVSNQFTKSEKVKAINLMKRLVRQGKNTNQVHNELKDAGYGYRRKNIQHDIRRFKTFENSKSPAARDSNKRWFDTVFEPFRKEKKAAGWSNNTINQFWEKAKTQSYENLTQAELDAVLALREMYSKKFEGYESDS